jgi:prepilin-type N-terminal cleavage/methylation domain-containing protein
MNRLAQKGFTIVELLIVIVVIGVLAAIVIVSYNGITNSANDSAVESDLATIAKKLEVYKATTGLYPANSTQLDAADFKVAQGSYMPNRNNLYYCRTNDFTGYAIGAQSKSGSNYYLVNGSVTPAAGVGGANTCTQLDPAASTWASTGMSDTNVWQAWTQ